MKRQIRNGVFETNSSSMHSLVIRKSNEYYTNEELHENLWLSDGKWEIWKDDRLTFGRYPFNCLCTFESKVRYAIASLCGYRRDAAEKFEEIKNLVLEIIPDCRSIELPTVYLYGEDEDGEDDEEVVCYGYVDEDILSSFLENENISLKEFLTNKKYVVIVDGDEYCIWKSLKESGLVDANEIEKEY